MNDWAAYLIGRAMPARVAQSIAFTRGVLVGMAVGQWLGSKPGAAAQRSDASQAKWTRSAPELTRRVVLRGIVQAAQLLKGPL